MGHTLGICAAAVTAATLAACGASQPPTLGPAELAVVTQNMDASLNAPLKAVHQNLVRSNKDQHLYPQELIISGPEDTTHTDWWLYKAGFLKLAGFENYQAYFTLTPEGEAFAVGTPPKWLATALQGQPKIACDGSSTAGVCKVSGIAVVSVTPEGQKHLAETAIPPQPFEATVDYAPAGWSVSALSLGDGGVLRAKSHNAIFGDAKAAYQSRMAYAAKVNREAAKLW